MQETKLHTSLAKLTERFRNLPAADGPLAADDYQASVVGPWWLRQSSGVLLASIGFHAWYGKRISADGNAINLRQSKTGLVEFLPMELAIENSRLDGQPAWVLRYPPSTHFPVRRMADELRILETGYLLGVSYTELPGLNKLGLPFLLKACT